MSFRIFSLLPASACVVEPRQQHASLPRTPVARLHLHNNKKTDSAQPFFHRLSHEEKDRFFNREDTSWLPFIDH